MKGGHCSATPLSRFRILEGRFELTGALNHTSCVAFGTTENPGCCQVWPTWHEGLRTPLTSYTDLNCVYVKQRTFFYNDPCDCKKASRI